MTFTMLAYTTQWEQEMKKKLFFSKRFFPEFNMEGLLRASIKARTEAYWKLWQMGTMNPDEIRAKENQNPIPDGLGQHFYVPLNMGTAENVIAGNYGKDQSTEKQNSEEETDDE